MPRLVHDRTTWVSYGQLGVWGFFLYGFGPVVPLLRDEQGTTAAVAGLHSTAIAVGSLAGGFLFPPLARWLGRGRAAWLGLAGVALGVAGLCAFRPLPATLSAVVVAATFGMLLVSGVNATLAGRHGPAAPAAISEANAACAGMGVLAPIVVGLTVSAGRGWRPALAVEIGLIALLALGAVVFRTPARSAGAPQAGSAGPVPARSTPAGSAGALPPGPAGPVPAGPVPAGPVPAGPVPAGPVPAGPAGAVPAPADAVGPAGAVPARPGFGRLPPAYWTAWVLLSVTGSIEVCLSLWAALELRTSAGMSAGAASAALAAIVAGMFLGRVVGGRIALRVAPIPLLLAAFALSGAGFTIFWTAPAAVPAVVGLLVLGMGNSLHYPLAISIALAAAGDQADRAAGYSSYSVAVGFGIAPVVLGWVADGVGPHLAFLLLPLFIAAAVLLAVRLRRELFAPAPA
ncbi:sugar MFS transporter [Plantactinospora sp. KBS50]|uniref:MFS transporter n=1 Tax=Plantactinospora sp. KBS50 TaxID=2024580 RepID=UPI000BAAAE8E|nr:MFS transporter [Plantactinospora sp. KBS50]ASW56700.1 MFS transporter [Plantactinospora sp. KBS50]